MKTSFYAKAISLLLVFGFTTSCQNTGGLWLGEGDNKGKSYTFGSSDDNQRLLDLAEAYSNKDTDKLMTMYPTNSSVKMAEKEPRIGCNLWRPLQ